MIYVWDLKNSKTPDYFFKNKGTIFSCVEKCQDLEPTKGQKIFVCGTDKTLREIMFDVPTGDKGSGGGQ